MNLIPWRRKHDIPVGRESAISPPIAQFRNEMDRLFDRFFRPGAWFEPMGWLEDVDRPAHDFLPSVDIAEDDAHITIRAEVPGMDAESIDINVSGNVLTIHGEKKESSEEKKGDVYHCERRFGSFTRSMELPATADLDQIDAEQRNGVLTIRVKKLPVGQARKIEVKASDRALTGATS